MQEEIEQKTINLCISTTQLTARTLLNVGRAYLRHQQGTGPHGKQSVKSLLRQNRGVSSLEIGTTGIRGFERYARRYGIDYAIRKDSTETPPRYLVFFKAPDAEAMNAALTPASGALSGTPGGTASTTPSARTAPKLRPGIWSFSRHRMPKP